MKILVTGCSWIQAMHKQQILRGNDFTFKSFGGQGLWRIESYLKDIQKDTFDFSSFTTHNLIPINKDLLTNRGVEKSGKRSI